MSLLRKLGPYIACFVTGGAAGAGLVYLLCMRLSREIAEIRKLLSELKREVELYSEGSQRKKNRPRITGQQSVTTSSGDDDEFVDAVGGLGEDAIAEPSGAPELLVIRQNVQFGPIISTEMKKDELDNELADHDLTGKESNPDDDGIGMSGETEIEDADAKTEEMNDTDQ